MTPLTETEAIVGGGLAFAINVLYWLCIGRPDHPEVAEPEARAAHRRLDALEAREGEALRNLQQGFKVARDDVLARIDQHLPAIDMGTGPRQPGQKWGPAGYDAAVAAQAKHIDEMARGIIGA